MLSGSKGNDLTKEDIYDVYGIDYKELKRQLNERGITKERAETIFKRILGEVMKHN